MGLIELGGWMMWPLLAVSVAALAIIVERTLVFMGCPFPDARFPGLVSEAARTGDVRPLAARLEAVPPLRDFAGLLAGPIPNREAALRLCGEALLERLEARLSLLSVLARLAPLMGLLGTILGMIATFSRIAEARSGVDMASLAGGIWQALLTTAAGLCIAIPALFFLSCFQSRVRRVADALNKAGNAALLADGCRKQGPSGGQGTPACPGGGPGQLADTLGDKGMPACPGAGRPRPGAVFRESDDAAPLMPEGEAQGEAARPAMPGETGGSTSEAGETPQRLRAAGEGAGDGGRSC